MTTMIVIAGPPGSGKTERAKAFIDSGMADVHHELDHVRKEFFGQKSQYFGQLKKAQDEKSFYESALPAMVRDEHYRRIQKDLKAGKKVVVSNLNVDPQRRKELYALAFSQGAKIMVYPIGESLSIDDLWEINSSRPSDDRMSSDRLRKYHKQFSKGWETIRKEATVLNYRPQGLEGQERWILFDLDGTLAENTYRSPFDYVKCDTDKPIWKTITLARRYIRDRNVKTMFLTGREYGKTVDDTIVLDKTVNWLKRYVSSEIVESDILGMRTPGDRDASYILKMNRVMEVLPENTDIEIYDDDFMVCNIFSNAGLLSYQVRR